MSELLSRESFWVLLYHTTSRNIQDVSAIQRLIDSGSYMVEKKSTWSVVVRMDVSACTRLSATLLRINRCR